MFANLTSSSFDDPDFKEDSVRELVIVPMLSRLGYLPHGEARVLRSKSLHHPFIRAGTSNHPVTIVPDYILLLKDKPVLILDAKRPTESVLDPKHVQQAYSYAIHPEILCKEFALCNGRELAIFSTDQVAPLLHLVFDEFESKWEDIIKYMSPEYLADPSRRTFAPDFGFKLNQMGFSPDATITILGARLNLFARVNDALLSASATTDFAGEPHFVSFDFPPSMLPAIVAGLPKPLAEQFCNALCRSPFMAAAGLVIELDLVTRLGPEIQGQSEAFMPLIIQEVQASRFNPEPVTGDPNDIPPYVFKLRDAFIIKDKPESE